MKNKGFTLIELLAVIIVLGIISLVAFPPIINQMRKMRDNVSAATLKIIESAAEKYMSNNLDSYPQLEDRRYCISLQELVNGGVLEDPLYDAQTGNKISLEKELSVDIGSSLSKSFELFDIGECGYIDPSGAKEPVLTSNMIPIVRSEDGLRWEKADVKREWYNYDELKWANAVLVTQSSRALYKQAAAGIEILESDILMYYVWIPRFRYKLFNTTFAYQSPRQIEVIFEGKRTTKSNGLINNQWLTHPAFSFGSLQLDGIWVGKFETAYNPATSSFTAQMPNPEQNRAVVKPNKYAWIMINVSNAYTVAKELNINGNIYGLGSNSDPHLMKNIEWGAVAYLSYSKYGNGPNIFTNPNHLYLTGCAGTTKEQTASACVTYNSQPVNQSSSTTGNIYGIYDMVAGTSEMVMGAQYLSGNTVVSTSSSGFGAGVLDHADMNKYLDKYLYGTTSNNTTAYARSKLGDAMGEVVFAPNVSWHSDYNRMVSNSVSNWLLRGESRPSGVTTGLMSFRDYDGSAAGNSSFRIVIINQ